jgi:hypothetical protein
LNENSNSNLCRVYIYEEGCVSYACVVCDDLDFDSLLVEERRGEERREVLLSFRRQLDLSAT